jgi:hypothetical protein
MECITAKNSISYVAGNKKQLELYAHPEAAGEYNSIVAGNINERPFA